MKNGIASLEFLSLSLHKYYVVILALFFEIFDFYLRMGYKGISIQGTSNGKIQFSSPFGPSLGVGLALPFQNKFKLKADYAVRFVGVFGMVNLVTVGVEF